MRFGLALWIALACSYGCGSKSEEVTREQCAAVADHIAAVMVDHCRTHPDECWDLELAGLGETGVPKTVTKPTFKSFLDSPEGKTWLMHRQGQWRSLNEAAVPTCIKKRSPKLVKCLLATKTHDDVIACDKLVDGDPPTTPK